MNDLKDYQLKLKSILRASGWTQDQAAHQLKVSFATLNSWINNRSVPRSKAANDIERLYLKVVGTEQIDPKELLAAKQKALSLKMVADDLTSNKELLDKLTLYLTYHTNTIEGSTMTLSDVGSVIFDHKTLTNRTSIEQAEARNHQAALHWLLDQLYANGPNFVISENLILNVHLRLMNGIISDAGQYRKHSVRIMGSQTVLANQAKIPELINGLVKDIEKPENACLEFIAQSHARFEQIHPFSDGNGRTGRLIMLAQALKTGLMPPLIQKERKYAYYKYLELAQIKDNYQPLEFFVAESIMFTDKILNDH